MLAILSFSQEGEQLAERLSQTLGSSVDGVAHWHREKMKAEGGLNTVVARLFQTHSHLCFIGAAGIAVRAIAPHLKDKFTDPAVLVVDDQGQFCISLLSGHVGGGNAFALQVAHCIGAVPVITTGTDRRQLGSLDLILQAAKVPLKQHRNDVLRINAGLLERQITWLYWEAMDEAFEGVAAGNSISQLNLSGFSICQTFEAFLKAVEGDPQASGIYIGTSKCAVDTLKTLNQERMAGQSPVNDIVIAIPRCWVLGTGSRKALDTATYLEAFHDYLEEQDLVPEAIAQLASVSIKANEACMAALASAYGYGTEFFSIEDLKTVHEHFERSEWVYAQLGVNAVAGPAAQLASGDPSVKGLFKRSGCTFALGRIRI